MIKGKTPDARSMLLALGVDSFLADMAIPFIWFLPGTVDPDSPSIIEINKAMQRGLRKLGYKRVKVNGVLDRETAMALDQISPPRGSWMHKTFVQILGDIISAMRNPERAAHKIEFSGLGDDMPFVGYFKYEGFPPGPLPGILVGTPPGPMGSKFGLGAVEGTTLDFGQGVRNKTNIVPIGSTTVAAFKNLQRQINRLLSRVGQRIAEDGIIGDNTFKAFQTAQGIIGQSIRGDETTLQMAKFALTIAGKLKQEADAMGISAGANKGRSASKASISEPTPLPMTTAQMASFGGPMAALKKYLPFLALAGGVAWYVSTQRKGKK